MNVAVDLDGTLAHWAEDARVCGEWIPGAQSFLREMLARGVGPIVHSCRATWDYGGKMPEIRRFLEDAGFVVSIVLDHHKYHAPKPGTVGIWLGEGKPVAAAYVDDRGVFFNGSWTDALADVERRMKS